MSSQDVSVAVSLDVKNSDMDYEYRFDKARHAWNSCYRVVIRHLLETDERFYDAAMLCMLVCMEEMSFLKRWREGLSTSSDWIAILETFFDEDLPTSKKQRNALKKHFVNCMRHQGTQENWGKFELEYDGKDEVMQHWNIIHLRNRVVNAEAYFITIFHVNFWKRCFPQIDGFYNEYQPQIPKTYGGFVKLVMPANNEDLRLFHKSTGTTE